ncbi:MAG: hypothetical protein AB8G15_00685 [Saprospiraceae bacterium]
MGELLERSLTKKNKEYNLNLNVQFVENVAVSGRFIDTMDVKAEEIRRKHNADMIIYGTTYIDDEKQKTIDLNWSTDPKWGFVDTIAVNSAFDDLPAQVNQINNRFIEGSFREGIDYIIYWISALSAYNQRNFLTSSKLLEDITNIVKRKETAIYSLLSGSYFYLNDLNKYYANCDSSLHYASSKIDSIYALKNVIIAKKNQGLWNEVAHYIKEGDLVTSRLSGDDFCLHGEVVFEEYIYLMYNPNAHLDIDYFLDRYNDYLDKSIQLCPLNKEDIVQLLSIQELLQNDTTINFEGKLMQKMEEITKAIEEDLVEDDSYTYLRDLDYLEHAYRFNLRQEKRVNEVLKKRLTHLQNRSTLFPKDSLIEVAYTTLRLANSDKILGKAKAAKKHLANILAFKASASVPASFQVEADFTAAEFAILDCEFKKANDLLFNLKSIISSESLPYYHSSSLYLAIEEGDTAQIKFHRNQILEIRKELLQEENLSPFMSLGFCYEDLTILSSFLVEEKLTEAEDYLSTVISKFENLPDTYVELTFNLYDLKHFLLRALEKEEAADEVLRELTNLVSKLPNTSFLEAVTTLNVFSMVDFYQEDYHSAKEKQYQILEILEQQETFTFTITRLLGQTYLNLSENYKELKDWEKATLFSKKALMVVANKLPKANLLVKAIVENDEALRTKESEVSILN